MAPGAWLGTTAALLIALATAAAAAAAAPPASAAQPVRFADDRGKTLTLPAPPKRIVSLLPSLSETLCELGACDRLVGTDRYSNWPAAVLALPKLGGLEDAQIERIVALAPDLVLVANTPRLIERLEALGVPVAMLIPDSYADARRTTGVLAAALGDAAAGERLWQRIEARIAAAAARLPAQVRGQRVYLEVANAPYAAGEASFIGQLMRQMGLANIVPAAMGPFPRLNPEFVLRAQPDVVIAAQAALAEMPSRPGWAALAALRNGRGCAVPPARWDTLVRSGPRLAEAADVIADCLTQPARGGPALPLAAGQR